MEGARAGGEDRRLFGRAAGGRERAPRDGRVFPVRSSQHAGERRTEVERDPGRVTAGGGGDQVTENTFSMTPFIYNLKTDKAKETYV